MKALLVDDHPLILSAMQALVRSLGPDMQADAVETAEELHAYLAAQQDVDIVLLDLRLGDADGLDVLAELRRRHPQLPVVVVSASEDPADVSRSINAGAMGFVPKRASNEMLFEALLMVLSGGVYLPATPATQEPAAPLSDASRSAMLDQPAEALSGRAAAARGAALTEDDSPAGAVDDHAATVPGGLHPRALPAAPVVPPGALAPPMPASSQRGPARTAQQVFETLGLTPRQLDALRLLLLGYSNKQIARELKLSVETVKDHVAAVLRALGVNSRTQAVLAVNQLLQRDGPR